MYDNDKNKTYAVCVLYGVDNKNIMEVAMHPVCNISKLQRIYNIRDFYPKESEFLMNDLIQKLEKTYKGTRFITAFRNSVISLENIA